MKTTVNSIVIFFTFFCAFLAPTYILTSLTTIDITKYLFLIIIVLLYSSTILKRKKISIHEIVGFIILILLCIAKKSIEPLHLIELVYIYNIIDSLLENDISNPKFKNLLKLSVVGIIIYSILYFNVNGRFLYTGLREINQSSFALFMIFLIIRRFNKRIGNICLLFGLLTFSRNYLLCLIIFYILETLKEKKSVIYDKLYSFFSFKRMIIICITILLALSMSFEIAYEKNNLSEYKNGIERYMNIYDYSNYFRFSTNVKVLKIYINNPKLSLTGLSDEEFYKYSYEISLNENKRYRQIKPHNYFFSYLRIYGIFSILIFMILIKIMNKILNKNNFLILIIILVYANILGIGFANYWLYLSIITMLVYRKNNINPNNTIK